ncbi:MAG: hypothetical protein ABH836_01515 [Candidatus Omnitrophota bacterium]
MRLIEKIGNLFAAGGNKKIYFFALASVLIGFLLVFFYQVMIEDEFVKFRINYSFYPEEETDKFFMLSGWKLKEEDGQRFATMKDERAIFLFYVPRTDALALNVIYRLNDAGQEIEVYGQDGSRIGCLKNNKPGKWVNGLLILPNDLVVNDLNKIVFMKKLNSKLDVSKLVVTNYEEKNLVLMRAYAVWQSTRWYANREDKPVNWKFCLIGGIGFLFFWLIYSALLASISDEKYASILRLDFWTYTPAAIIFLTLFVIGKVISNYTFFYYGLDYWLILAGSVFVGKFYQLIKYARKQKIGLRSRQAGNFIVEKYDLFANIMVICFMVLFLGAIVFYKLGLKVKPADLSGAFSFLKLGLTQEVPAAEIIGNWSFLFLIAAVILKVMGYFIEMKYSND